MRITSHGKPKDPFSTALEALRHAIASGRMVLGEPLTVTDRAQDLGLSATPIREALSRLAGEGLIEDRRGRGYFARRLDISDLVELYGLRSLYLVGAVEGALVTQGRGAWIADDVEHQPATGPAQAIRHVFDHVIAQGGNRALFEAYRVASDRLAPAAIAESELFPLQDERAALQEALAQTPAERVQAIIGFHQARQERAGELVRVMRARATISSL